MLINLGFYKWNFTPKKIVKTIFSKKLVIIIEKFKFQIFWRVTLCPCYCTVIEWSIEINFIFFTIYSLMVVISIFDEFFFWCILFKIFPTFFQETPWIHENLKFAANLNTSFSAKFLTNFDTFNQIFVILT